MLKYPKPLISLLLMTCFSSYPKSFKQLILFKMYGQDWQKNLTQTGQLCEWIG